MLLLLLFATMWWWIKIMFENKADNYLNKISLFVVIPCRYSFRAHLSSCEVSLSLCVSFAFRLLLFHFRFMLCCRFWRIKMNIFRIGLCWLFTLCGRCYAYFPFCWSYAAHAWYMFGGVSLLGFCVYIAQICCPADWLSVWWLDYSYHGLLVP